MKRIVLSLFLLISFHWLLADTLSCFPPHIDSLIEMARKEKASDHALIASGLYEKARLQLKKLSPETCSPASQFFFFNEALSMIEENLALAQTKVERQIYLRTEYPFLEDGLDVCRQLYKQNNDFQYLKKAFEIIEKSKSLINYFQNHDLKKAFQVEPVPDSIIARRAKLNSAILALKDSIRIKRNMLQIKRLQVLGDDLFTLNAQLRSNYPNYYQFIQRNEIAPIDSILNNLNSDETILEYFFGKESVYLLILGKQQQTLLKIAATNDANNLLMAFFKGLKDPAFYKEMVPVAHQVYEVFIQPAISHLSEQSKITIIPDGLLGAVPLEACLKTLPKKLNYDFTKLDYLIHHYQISYNNSATQFFQQNLLNELEGNDSQSSLNPHIAAFAPTFDRPFHDIYNKYPKYQKDQEYLKATSDSLIRLTQNLDWLSENFSATTYKREKATLTNFKQHFGTDILHFGTHVIFDPKLPMQSKIVLAKEIDASQQLKNGFLTLEMLQTFQLQGDLAVLVGCESGRGIFRRASGTNSLAYGFNMVGIPSTLYSLWKVNEKESAALIQLFYEKLQQNLPKDEALHQAKLTYLERAQDFKAAPAFWAAFVINGDMSAFEFSNRILWEYFLLGILTFCFVVYFFRNRPDQ